jgi:NAD(P)-dependent dehydrogenase (short-subunit alcohol dehydrogenase family)
MVTENCCPEILQPFNFKGKTALVTGSAQGLGREIALALARLGASLVLADTVRPEKTAADIVRNGFQALAIGADISQETSVIDLLKKAVSRFHQVDLLINNAGLSQLDFIPTEDTPMEQWDRVMGVNMRGTFLCCKHVGKHLIEKGGGTIVNIASTAGFTGIPRAAAYCASKAGVISLTKSLAVEWARYNIRVNAVAPHYIETEMTRGLRNSPKVYEGIINQIPLQRFAKPEEVIGSILFLCSPASAYITGAVLAVDGGFLA